MSIFDSIPDEALVTYDDHTNTENSWSETWGNLDSQDRSDVIEWMEGATAKTLRGGSGYCTIANDFVTSPDIISIKKYDGEKIGQIMWTVESFGQGYFI